MTYEEAIEEMENIYQNGFDNDFDNDEIEKPLDAIRLAIEALEKQMPKRHHIEVNSRHEKELICPNCAGYHGTHGRFGSLNIPRHSKHCPWCGQAIDWSEK